MIKNRFVHFNSFAEASSVKFSANAANTSYVNVLDNGRKVSSVTTGTPDIDFTAICFIKDSQTIVTHGQAYVCVDTLPGSGSTDSPAVDQDVLVEARSLPAASADTLNKIYYITDPTASGVPYTKKYITIPSRSSYIWDEFTVSEEYIMEVVSRVINKSLSSTINSLIETEVMNAVESSVSEIAEKVIQEKVTELGTAEALKGLDKPVLAEQD